MESLGLNRNKQAPPNRNALLAQNSSSLDKPLSPVKSSHRDLHRMSSSVLTHTNKGGNSSSNKMSAMDMHKLVSEGEIDHAAWRKRKQAREEKRKQMNRELSKKKNGNSGSSPLVSSGLSSKRTFKRRKFDYMDPVDDVEARVKNTPMANLTMMKFHEMKVEREPFNSNNERQTARHSSAQPTNQTNQPS